MTVLKKKPENFWEFWAEFHESSTKSIISIVLLIIATYGIFALDPGENKWAIAMLGTVAGYWLR